MATILISGGTGLIGQALSKALTSQGHQVRLLSRKPSASGNIPSFYWNVEKQEIDDKAFAGVDHVVHLAGAGIADKRWTRQRKEEIIRSRTDSTKLIASTLTKLGLRLNSFVGASAIGIYGMITSDKIFSEADRGPQDFLWETCELWERSYDELGPLTDKSCVLRIGVVLSAKGGALQRLIPLFRAGLGSAIGSGKQYMPWIHIDDLVALILEALFDGSFSGTYNAVATEQASNRQFSKSLANVLGKPFFMPSVPGFAMKLLYGEMANVFLEGSRVSNRKLLDTGFRFRYPALREALNAIVHRS